MEPTNDEVRSVARFLDEKVSPQNRWVVDTMIAQIINAMPDATVSKHLRVMQGEDLDLSVAAPLDGADDVRAWIASNLSGATQDLFYTLMHEYSSTFADSPLAQRMQQFYAAESPVMM